MRNIVYLMNLSVDGFTQGPDGSFDWGHPDDTLHQFFNDQIKEMGGFLYGRRMYETMDVWHTLDQDPQISPVMAEFARIWREKPKYVFSTTLESVSDSYTLFRGDVAAEVAKLKAGTGGDLSVGGPDLAKSLAEHDLIDEYRMVLWPVLVGGGKPFFPTFEREIPLKLVETRVFDSGNVYLRYRRA